MLVGGSASWMLEVQLWSPLAVSWLPMNTLREDIQKKRLSFGHCPKVALTPGGKVDLFEWIRWTMKSDPKSEFV